MYLPGAAFTAFKEQVQTISSITCTEYECFSDSRYCAYLTPYMKPLTIKLDGVKYVIPPEGYTYTPTLRESTEKCVLAVS